MGRILVPGLFLALICFAPLCLSQDARWVDYSPYWCTPLGRMLVIRGTTSEECQSYCGEGCGAIEWWEGGSQACYLCTDLSLLMSFPHANDLSYPPHVFIKQSDVEGTSTTIPAATTTEPRPTTSDEGIPTTVPHEKMTTSFIEEVSTSSTTIDEEYISSTPDQEETMSSSNEVATSSTDHDETSSAPVLETKGTTILPNEQGTMSTGSVQAATTSATDQEVPTSIPHQEQTTAVPDQEGTTSPSQERTTSSPDQEGPTSPPDQEGTTAGQEHDGTTSSPGEEGTTSSPDEVGTTSFPDEESMTSSPDQEGTTSSPDELETTSSPDEEETTSSTYEERTTPSSSREGTTSSPDEEGTTSSPGEEGTTSSPDEVGTTSSSAPGQEGTTSSPDELGTTSSPDEEETTSSPYEERTTPSSSREGTTSSPDEEGTTSSPDEERTTSSPDEVGTTSFPDKERMTSSSSPDQEGITSSPDEEGTTSSPDEEGTTSSPDEERTTPSSSREGTTSSPDEEGTTSLSDEEETTSSPDEEGTMSAPDEEGTTSSPDAERKTSSSSPGQEGTSSPDEEGTTSAPSSPSQEGTTSSPDEVGTTSSSSPGQEGATSSPDEEVTMSSPDDEETTSSPDEERTTSSSSPVQEGTTSSPEEEGTSLPDEELTTSSPDQEGTTSTPVVEGTTSSPDKKATTSPPDDEGTTTSPDEESTTSSSTSSPVGERTRSLPSQEGTTPSPTQEGTTSLPSQEETTSSPIQEGSTSSPDQEGATSLPVGGGTTSSPVEGKSTTSPDEEESTPFPDKEETTPSPGEGGKTSSPVDEGTATSPDRVTTSTPEKETSTSVPDHQVTTSAQIQVTTTTMELKTTTSAPEQSHPTTPRNTLPGVPLNVRTRAVSETEVEIAWDAPHQGSENIQYYRVNVMDVNEVVGRIFRVPGDTLTVDSLTPETKYRFRVSAANQHGIGIWSEAVYAETSSIQARIEEPDVELSHRTDFVVAGMDKSTRAICFVRGQEFLGWFKSSGEQITGTSPSDRMFVEYEDDSYSLVIRRLMLSDGGEYVCRGSKTSATYSLYVEFSVEDPPARQVLWLNTEGEIFVGVKVGYPAPEYLWKKDGVKFDANSGRFSLQPDGTLKIISVAAEDDGDYTVRISQLNRRRETTERIKVVVYDPPQIDITRPSTRNLTFGYPARLDCLVSGIPKPEITWTGPDETPVTFSESNPRVSLDSDGSLLLSQAVLSDIGPWTCEAINSVGTASRQIDVQAIYMPPEIHQLSNITANEGDNEVLNCTTSGFPLPDVIWFKDNEEYPGQRKKPGESLIDLESLGLEDISQFTCEASNSATDEEGEVIVRKATINLFVMVEPRPFDSDRMKEPVYSVLGNPDPVRLACAFTGYPPPEVWIEKNGSVVATGIESVWVELTTDSLDNYGVYYCVAENVVSRSKLNYTFEIKRSDAPKFTLEPKLPARNPTAGFPLTLTWNVSGIPKPEVRWKSPSGENVTSDNPRFMLSEGKLTITSLDEVDVGIWTLEATNPLQTTTVHVDLSLIYVPPQITRIPDVVVNEGETATLTCSAWGVPTPDIKWIKEGVEYFDQKKSPGKSEISIQNVGLDDNLQFTCQAKNGAQDDEGIEILSEQSVKLFVRVEPRPVNSMLRPKPVLSYVGNPKPTVFNCEFSGYPPPDVRIIKDDEVLASSKESLSFSVTVDSLDDFGEYVCIAENDVNVASKNYTFEIRSSDAPSSPQDFTGEATCDSAILSWNHPKEHGGFPIINYIISYGDNTLVISSNSTDYIIDNLDHSKEYSISIQARTEAAISDGALVKLKTTQFCKISSCVNIDHDEEMYTLNASQGRWPRDGFCRALSAYTATEPDMYRISADFYVPGSKGSMLVNYVGIFFNAENEDNFDFMFFRVGANGNPCFQTGEIQQGRLNWYESQMGSCPHGPPRKARWIHVILEVRKSDVSVFLEGVHVTSFKGHFPPKAAGGVLLANYHGNVVQFKDFIITDLPSLPFETKSCATVKDNMKYYSVISQGDFWAQGFCRALLKDIEMEESPSYQVSVDLFSELGWSGDRIAYVGIMFNARDINNADFIYFRPYWKDHCYQTGYIMGGVQKRDGSKTGPCSCTVAGGKWFNVRLEIRRNVVSVFMNDKPAATFKSHYPTNNKGSGILVTGGCRKSIRFRNLTVSSLPLLPFTAKNCQSARDAGEYYKLMAYPGIEDTTQPGVCRALYPKAVKGDSYVIGVSFYTQGSLLGGKYGVMFNVKNADSFEFVYFRPYNRDNCVQIGYLQGTKVSEGDGREPKSLTCAYGFMRGGSWYNVRVKVSGSEVKVLIDDVQVAVFKSRFPTVGRGGIMVASGFKRKISFKDFYIL